MMIEVNLLPQEMRRVEHTPLPRFLVIIAGTVLVSIALALGAVINLRKLPDMIGAGIELDTEIRDSARAEREHDLLLGQIDGVKHRKRAIAEIWRSRIIWSRKLDELADMIPKFIGLDKLKLEETRRSGRGRENGGYLNMASICAGADVDRLAMFRRILRGSYPAKGARNQWIGRTWFEDFIGISATPWSRKDMPDYEEKEALTFELKLEIKPDSQRIKEFLENYNKQKAIEHKSARQEQKKPPTTRQADLPSGSLSGPACPVGRTEQPKRTIVVPVVGSTGSTSSPSRPERVEGTSSPPDSTELVAGRACRGVDVSGRTGQ